MGNYRPPKEFFELVEKINKRELVFCYELVLRRMLSQHKLHQSEVATLTNVPCSTFNDWTAGRTPRDIAIVYIIAKFFNVSFEYMCFGEDKDQEFMKKKLETSMKDHRLLELENAMLKMQVQPDMFRTAEDIRIKILEIQSEIEKLKNDFR